jgi:hypothetical protein
MAKFVGKDREVLKELKGYFEAKEKESRNRIEDYVNALKKE